MADYDGNWIEQLDETQPLGTQTKSLGDNAIREIKRALTNAFPNSPIGDFYSGTLSQLDDLVADSTIPRGAIMMWSGTDISPPGWTICDGRNRDEGAGPASPNLINRFIIGAGSPAVPPFSTPVGTTGGSTQIVVETTSGTAIKYTTDGTSLQAAHIPNLNANLQVAMASSTQSDSHTLTTTVARGQDSPGSQQSAPITTTGLTGQAHTHTFKIDTSGSNADNPNLPPYYALIYIIKD